MKTIKEIRQAIQSEPTRSAWSRGVKEYALELIEEMGEDQMLKGDKLDRETLLNGADNWSQYSYGGCALVYDADIAERTCSPSELKKTRNGERRPNSREEWLDVQARALQQAANMIMWLARA